MLGRIQELKWELFTGGLGCDPVSQVHLLSPPLTLTLLPLIYCWSVLFPLQIGPSQQSWLSSDIMGYGCELIHLKHVQKQPWTTSGGLSF